MSYVTNYVLFADDEDPGLADFLSATGLPLLRVDQYAGGNKGMELDVWACAQNYSDDEKVKDTFFATKWKSPDDTALLIRGEDGPSMLLASDVVMVTPQ